MPLFTRDRPPDGSEHRGLQPSGFQPSGFRPSGFQPSGFQHNGFGPTGFQPGGFDRLIAEEPIVRPGICTQRSFDELGEPLREVTFVVVDLETTGGSSLTEAITEVGAVKVRGGEVLGEFATLVDPGRSIPPQITILTGITDSMVYDAPRIDAVIPPFLEFIRGCVLVAHNAPFDVGFLKAACARLGLPWPGPAVVDTVRLARKVLTRDEAPSVRLSALAPLLGATVAPDHRALTDARATVDVLHALFERLGSLGVHSLSELQDASRDVSPERRRKRRLADHLPAAPGVYLFRGPNDEVLYVGTSGNLHQRVRSYFSAAETRDRIKHMVALAQRVDHVECAHALEAHIREQRLIAIHQPPYNRRSRRPGKISWVTLTDEAFPRLSIVRSMPDRPEVCLGPFPSRQAAQTAVEALQDAVPIRRCTSRIRRLDPDGSPCALAELGRCGAACAGLEDAAVVLGACPPDPAAHRRRFRRDPDGPAGTPDDAVPVGPFRPGGADPRPAVRSCRGSGSPTAAGGIGRHRRDRRRPTRRPRRVGPDRHSIRTLRGRRSGAPRGRSDAGGRTAGVVGRNGSAPARSAAGSIRRGDDNVVAVGRTTGLEARSDDGSLVQPGCRGRAMAPVHEGRGHGPRHPLGADPGRVMRLDRGSRRAVGSAGEAAG